MKKILLIFVIGLSAYACAKVPLTGRNQLSLVSSGEIQPLVNEQYSQVINESKIVNGTPEGQLVLNVGNKMAKAVEQYLASEGYGELANEFNWEFNLIQNEAINAWCMPGGKVAFYTGIMPIAQNDAGVAVIMGHEIAHAVASHARERMSTGLVTNFGVGVLSSAMGQNPTLTQNILLQSVGIGSELGALKFSRNHELEADQMGLIFMAIAGYDPRQAPLFWERMSAAGGQAPPEFLSTHPGPASRIAKLNSQMPEALKYYKP